jgi:hypothetical protein
MKYTYLILALSIAAYSSFAQKVHISNYENQADIKVFEVKYESQADLKVYKVKYKSSRLDQFSKKIFI